MAEQRASKVRRLADAVAELPSCCARCEYLEACTAHEIACMDFVRWVAGRDPKNGSSASRVATREVFDLAFCTIPDVPKKPRLSHLFDGLERMLCIDADVEAYTAPIAPLDEMRKDLAALRAYLNDIDDIAEYAASQKHEVKARAKESVRVTRAALLHGHD